MSGHNGGRHEGENAAYEARASYEEVAGMPVSCSAADAARILGISATHVQRLAAQGKLPGCKVGYQWRFSTRRLLAMLDGEGM